MKLKTLFILIYLILSSSSSYSYTFDQWKDFKKLALSEGISEDTVDSIMINANFLKLMNMTDINLNLRIRKLTSQKEHLKILSGLNYYKKYSNNK